jgi:UDP-N-acetylmuramyl pentapeptide synthase
MHGGIVKHIKKVQPNIVFTVGKFSELIKKNLPEKFHSLHFYDYKEVYNALMKVISNGDVVMIKGSNSSNVNKISQKLLEAQ